MAGSHLRVTGVERKHLEGGSRLGKATKDGSTQEEHIKTTQHFIKYAHLHKYGIFLMKTFIKHFLLFDKLCRHAECFCGAQLNGALSFHTHAPLSRQVTILHSTTAAKRGRKTGQMDPGRHLGGAHSRGAINVMQTFLQSAS